MRGRRTDDGGRELDQQGRVRAGSEGVAAVAEEEEEEEEEKEEESSLDQSAGSSARGVRERR